MVQTTPSNIDNAGIEYLAAIVKIAAERAAVPVALHLDRNYAAVVKEKILLAGAIGRYQRVGGSTL